MPWDCFCPKCKAGNVGGMEDNPDLMEIEMDEYRGKNITCDSCGCIYDFDTGEIQACDTCQRKHLDYKYFCIDCEPYNDDHTKSNYEDMHESEEE